jgi:hypothetical protein
MKNTLVLDELLEMNTSQRTIKIHKLSITNKMFNSEKLLKSIDIEMQEISDANKSTIEYNTSSCSSTSLDIQKTKINKWWKKYIKMMKSDLSSFYLRGLSDIFIEYFYLEDLDKIVNKMIIFKKERQIIDLTLLRLLILSLIMKKLGNIIRSMEFLSFLESNLFCAIDGPLECCRICKRRSGSKSPIKLQYIKLYMNQNKKEVINTVKSPDSESMILPYKRLEDIIANDNKDFIADSVLCNECIELYRSI